MRVSVIIPAYNAEKTIEATLSSVLGQTYTDMEIIVVDDGSTDKTAALIAGFATRDARIVSVQQKNTGVSGARHHGLQSATGDFVATIDADDLWHPTKIEKQVAALVGAPENVTAVYCWSRRIDENDKVVTTQPAVRAEGFVLCRHVYDNIAGNGSCLMVRRKAALMVGGFRDEHRDVKRQTADDHLFQLRLAIGFLYVVVPEYLVGYRVVEASVSGNKDRLYKSVMQNLEIVRTLTDKVPERVYRWSRAASLFDQLGFQLRKGNMGHFLSAATQALWLDPVMCLDRVRLALVKAVRAPFQKDRQPLKAYYDLSPDADVVEDTGLHLKRMRILSRIDQDAFKASYSKPRLRHVSGWRRVRRAV